MFLSAAEIDTANDKKILEDDHLDVEYRGDDILQQAHTSKSHDVINGLDTEKSKIYLHLQHLEADLTSAVHTLRTKVNGTGSQKVYPVFLLFLYSTFIVHTTIRACLLC